MARSFVAVLAGLAVAVGLVMVLSVVAAYLVGMPAGGPPTTGYLALNLLGGVIAGVGGGATAFRLAPHRPHGHVFTLALVIVLLSLPGVFSAPAPGQPAWYPLVLSVLGPGSVLLGGVLALRTRREPPEPDA